MTQPSRIVMNIKGLSRYIENPFALCGDKEMLKRIGQEIIEQASLLDTYGWIRVDINHPAMGCSGGNPLEWIDK